MAASFPHANSPVPGKQRRQLPVIKQIALVELS
jgi:hypothetical protein